MLSRAGRKPREQTGGVTKSTSSMLIRRTKSSLRSTTSLVIMPFLSVCCGFVLQIWPMRFGGRGWKQRMFKLAGRLRTRWRTNKQGPIFSSNHLLMHQEHSLPAPLPQLLVVLLGQASLKQDLSSSTRGSHLNQLVESNSHSPLSS